MRRGTRAALVAVAWASGALAAIACLRCDPNALILAPALVLVLALALGWFPGEGAIARRVESTGPRRARGAPRMRLPRLALVVLACPGADLRQGFARRPPPLLTV